VFIGHFGVAFGAKTAAPRVSLGSLFLAAQFIDLLWPTFLLLGWEEVRIAPGITTVTPLDFVSYPLSHSLLAVIAWALIVAAIYLFLCRYPRGALVLATAVISHWLLDALVHRPDLPLYPGGTILIGLGLWSSVGVTLAVELPILVIGLWIYVRATAARDPVGYWALWGLVAFLLAIYAANLLGPPPPSAIAVAWVAQAQWLLVVWGYWVDRHRRTVG
jgi:hypothetical protein